MQSRDGNYRIVLASFAYDGSAITIAFPTTRTLYYLFNDRTGHFGNESLTWEFDTSETSSRMTTSGTQMTQDLAGALSNYQLIVIGIVWPDGRTTDFYRQENGTWMMNGRDGGFSSVSPRIRDSSGLVYIGFPNSSNEYALSADGSGTFGNERFRWSYSFISS